MHLMVPAQSKLNYCQQCQNDAIDVDDDSYLLGVVEDLHCAYVEGHEHSNQLQEPLVGIRDGQPHDGTVVHAYVHIVGIVDATFLSFAKMELDIARIMAWQNLPVTLDAVHLVCVWHVAVTMEQLCQSE